MCNLTIHGHNIDVTEAIELSVKDKLNKLKSINLGTRATLTFKQEGVKFEAHLVYHIKDKDIVAKKTHEDLYVAIGLVFDTVRRQLRKAKINHKSKQSALKRKQAAIEPLSADDDSEQQHAA
jgi:ribosomal subunit interface protein